MFSNFVHSCNKKVIEKTKIRKISGFMLSKSFRLVYLVRSTFWISSTKYRSFYYKMTIKFLFISVLYTCKRTYFTCKTLVEIYTNGALKTSGSSAFVAILLYRSSLVYSKAKCGIIKHSKIGLNFQSPFKYPVSRIALNEIQVFHQL